MHLLVKIFYYTVFILFTLAYFRIFRKDKLLKYGYYTFVPTFFCIYMLINQSHTSEDGAWRFWLSAILFSLLFFCVFWSVYAIRTKNKP